MFRVTNRSAVFQMVWLQDVVKVTLQTFSSAVGLFKKKKKYCIFWSHDSTFLVLVLHIYLAEVLGKSLCFLGARYFIGNLSRKFKISPNNYKLSFVLWRKTYLKPEKWTTTVHKTQLFKKCQYRIQQNHNNEILERGSSAQRNDDKSFLIQ